MKKADLLNLIRDELELGTKKGAQEFLDNVDKVFEALAEKLEAGEGKVGLGSYIKLEKKHFESKTGICNGKEYTVDEHDEILVRRSNKAKNVLR